MIIKEPFHFIPIKHRKAILKGKIIIYEPLMLFFNKLDIIALAGYFKFFSKSLFENINI